MYKGHNVATVVLAYNAGRFISSVVDGLPDFIDRIYVIDDASRDNTIQVVRKIDNPKLSLILRSTNGGPGAALLTGYQAALKEAADIVVKVDGDGQMPPGQIEDLIMPIVSGRADYTKGDRLSIASNRRGMPRFRLFGNWLLTWLTHIASGYWHINDTQNGFTAISAKALKATGPDLYHHFGYLNDLLVRLNIHHLRVIDVPMPARYGSEKSCIRLGTFVGRVSFLLLRCFFWRLRVKYLWRLHVEPG